MTTALHSIPGVYRRPAPRQRTFRRVRTDVLGIVGVAGPRHVGSKVRVDDWHSYVREFLTDERGDPIEVPPGSQTAATVQAFFANGGASCVVVNVAARIDPAKGDELLNEMLGLRLPIEPMERVGLELLLLDPEVALIILPELDATEVTATTETAPLPPSAEAARFGRCVPRSVGADASVQLEETRLYDDNQVLFAQRALLSRLRELEWRWFAILAPPPQLSHEQALAWKKSLTDYLGPTSNAALYWPWLTVQPTPGAPVVASSPVGHVAGVFARRDLEVGPHVAPANEELAGVVGVEQPLVPHVVANLTDRGVNVIRPSVGYGIELWGARTLRWQDPRDSRSDGLAYVNVRRCLTAIERTVEMVAQPAVFEPNLPLLRAQLTSVIAGYLMTVFESGALKGESSQEAFRVRCDASNNPTAAVDVGQLLCEVDVAIAAAAEFIVFRVGRSEGVVEIEESA